MNHPLRIKAKALSQKHRVIEKEIIETLIEIDKKRFFVTWGYSSLFQYVLEELGFTESQTSNYIAVTRKATEVPALRQAIREETVSVSKARKITSVIKEENAFDWISKANELKTAALEKEVAKVNPEKRTRETIRFIDEDLAKVSLCISDRLLKKLKRLQDLHSQKNKKSLSLEETLECLADDQLKKIDPLEKKTKPVLGHVPSYPTARKQILKEKKGTCEVILPTGKPCGHTRFINAHHHVTRANGGTNELKNLHVLCYNHHQWVHETKPHQFIQTSLGKASTRHPMPPS